MRAWRRSSGRDCKQLGTNPFLTPFNVFVPLTCCLTFGVHSSLVLLPLGLPLGGIVPQSSSPWGNCDGDSASDLSRLGLSYVLSTIPPTSDLRAEQQSSG